MEIRRLLVANRGEIALRIFRACAAEEIATVAVVAPDDTGSLHARAGNETVSISDYLHGKEHIRAAKQSGADAIHPGYGFLAESAEFAEAVEAAGIVFVGPSPEALRRGGDKLEAKKAAAAAGVPVLGVGEPDSIGYPLMIKAAAGGGGRGMRVVGSPAELDEAAAAAQREAKAAFGDDAIFFEPYLPRARHVEIQLLADSHGNVHALGERECSVQRRHQKVLEEAPSPAVDGALRTRMSDAAVAFARAIGYRSLGTAEFLLDGDDFYFLELNGRIQVEHPVTEEAAGLDLARLQLAVARGEELREVTFGFRSHAVEVRLYAEDPETFLPQAGTITRLRLPDSIRVDAGVAEGNEVGVAYDPMIAKLIAAGTDRPDALDRLAGALDDTVVEGVTTNLPFLRWLVGHPVVNAGRATTAFLTEYPPLSSPPRRLAPGVWASPWRLNLPDAPPTAVPDPDAASHDARHTGAQASLTAPMPGTVIRVAVSEGDEVAARQPLVVLEAMKMETPIVAPYAAVVRSLHVAEGDRVAGGALLVELEE